MATLLGLLWLLGLAICAGARRWPSTCRRGSPRCAGSNALEYLLLALVLSTVGLLFGGTAGWFVVREVLDLPWAPSVTVVATTLAAAAAITLGVGLLGSLPVLRTRPS